MSLVNASQHHRLVADLTVSLDCCKVLADLLNDRLQDLDRTETGSLSTLGKGQLVWEETDMRDYLNHLNHQTNALNLLLTAFQWSGFLCTKSRH